jgi:hypothetical protein
VVDLNDVREAHQPRRQQDVLALGLGRNSLAVPALKRLIQAFTHLVVETEPSRQLVGRRPVIRDHLPGGTSPIADELDAHASPLHQPLAGADMAQDERPRSHPGHVNVTSLVLERLVVPEPLRLLVSVDVTTDPGDQADVVHDRARLVIEPQPVSEPQRDQRLAHHVLHRLAHAQVGSQ